MRPSPPAISPEQEFPYGWRFVNRDGELVQMPLTLEDCLHPQEGDYIVNSYQHNLDCMYLATVFRSRPLAPPYTLVSCDLLINWGRKDIRGHGPDIAVFVGLNAEPDRFASSLDLERYAGRCILIIEVVSPHTRDNDVVHKFDHYFRLGIPFYVIVDQQREGGPRTIRAYRRRSDRYVPVEADDSGRIDLPLLGLMIALRDERVVCLDVHFNELGDYTEVSHALAQLEETHAQLEKNLTTEVELRHNAQRFANEARAETERAQKEADRQRQEAERAQKEVDRQRQEVERAQKEADRQRQETERAQKEADQQRLETERAQKEADRQRLEADRQREARDAAFEEKRLAEDRAAQRIRDLEAQLLRLQEQLSAGGPPAAQ